MPKTKSAGVCGVTLLHILHTTFFGQNMVFCGNNWAVIGRKRGAANNNSNMYSIGTNQKQRQRGICFEESSGKMIYVNKESSGRAVGHMRADAARPQTLTGGNYESACMSSEWNDRMV